jgi:hypothetical protein
MPTATRLASCCDQTASLQDAAARLLALCDYHRELDGDLTQGQVAAPPNPPPPPLNHPLPPPQRRRCCLPCTLHPSLLALFTIETDFDLFQPPPHAFVTLERLCSQLMVKLDR